MPKEEDLEREWRALVSRKLDGIDRKSDKIEEDIHKINLELAKLSVSEVVPRLEQLERSVRSLENFKAKAVGLIVGVQIVIGIAWGVLKFFWKP